MLRHIEDREVIWKSWHSYTKGKSCLTDLVAFYDGMSASGDKGIVESFMFQKTFEIIESKRTTDFIFLAFCKAFFPHKSLLSKLEIYGFDLWTIQWIRNRTVNLSHRIVGSGLVPKCRPVMGGIPQKLVLGLVLINIFINVWGIECILSKFADDAKLNSVADMSEG